MLYALLLVKERLTTGASVNLFKSAVVCVAVVVMCGCDQGQPTPPVASNPTPVEDMELPESATSIGTKFRMIAADTITKGDGDHTHEAKLAKLFKTGVRDATQAQREQVMDINSVPLEHA